MAYRISLHLLVTIWHLLLLALALSLKKIHRYYSALIPVCLYSASFTAAWALGLIFESELFMRLTWVGALWPAALLLFIRKMFGLPSNRWLKGFIWSLAIVNVVGGLTPYCLVRIDEYEPVVTAIYGPLEPFLRIVILLQIAAVLWTSVRQLLTPGEERGWSTKIALVSFSIYGIGALFTCGLLPLFGEYRLLESTSYGSVIWTTFAVWYVFQELRERNRSLMELDTMKKELINHVTHEFRTPLGAISSAVEIIDATKPHEKKKLKDYLRMIDSNVSRLSHFVNELLDLAAIQQAKVRLNKTEADLFSLIEKTVTRLKPLAEKQRIKISLEGASLPYVCDEEKIEQVIGNLVSNAIKASPNGQVEIKVSQCDDQIEISVTDNGIGISQEHLDHVFSSFYRVAIKGSPHKGTGLGLAIARGWVQAHGGKIWAESDGHGSGTTFKIVLPSSN